MLSQVAGSPFSAPRCTFILCAVCQVRMMTSPTRPIACESEDIIDSAPRSCRMSSAAMVSLRMRDSAKATSSAIAASRDRKSTRLNSSHTEIYTLSLHDALPIYHRQRAEVVQDVLGSDGLLADARFGEGDVLRDRRIEVMADHQHVEMLCDGVHGERACRIGRGRQH